MSNFSLKCLLLALFAILDHVRPSKKKLVSHPDFSLKEEGGTYYLHVSDAYYLGKLNFLSGCCCCIGEEHAWQKRTHFHET